MIFQVSNEKYWKLIFLLFTVKYHDIAEMPRDWTKKKLRERK